MTLCPGKKQPNAATGAWNRDLGLDLDVVAKWGAAAVLTLIVEYELQQLQILGLREEAEARHMAWRRLPIKDGGIPGEEMCGPWAIISHYDLLPILRDGFNVLAQCKGGLGPAGITVADLMIQLGVLYERAVAQVCEARPGAIETPEQEIWAMQVKAEAEWLPDRSEAEIANWALGAMLGLAAGDALGTTLEYKQPAWWRSRRGRRRG